MHIYHPQKLNYRVRCKNKITIITILRYKIQVSDVMFSHLSSGITHWHCVFTRLVQFMLLTSQPLLCLF